MLNYCIESFFIEGKGLTLSHIQQSAADEFENILLKNIESLWLKEVLLIKERWKHCGQRRYWSLWAISLLVGMFSSAVCFRGARTRLYAGKGKCEFNISGYHIFS